MDTRKITEGTTEVEVPSAAIEDKLPVNSPVFYNSHMELNRDITVAATSVFVKEHFDFEERPPSEIDYVDAMAASGIRGLRIANEICLRTTLNDWDAEACEFIEQNIELNGLSDIAETSCRNANALLHEKRFNIVDLDPFGSPAPYLDAASRSAVHLLEVTATDTAPLCGAHLNSGIRKYAAVALNNEYHSEMGLRILLGSIARHLARHEKGMEVLLSHATRHYVRAYVGIKSGAKNADRTLKELGYVTHCGNCSYREWKKGYSVFMEQTCPECGNEMNSGGLLWLGKLHENIFCSKVMEEIEKRPLGKKKKACKIIQTCLDELDIPFFYDQHRLCKQLSVAAPRIEKTIEDLRDKGYEASRTHFSGMSFKTNAPISVIKQILSNMY
ncbi:tRNA (guanine(10)-N(2))-dimethyltransferase [Methanohalophilus mahii]|uniref:tRNA (guanine(26)-N(2))-dimethyltransferase n=1 Tax=Methanohalophilus mahii (strain ATCC 35705 / DSM 5219 / SLP) TaxID=547558 RepID=D5EBU9_METMS|nr:tRNA (guanine(10)-N(2))-dimethyltransferase [Methanohalophilus mahii]ADE36650.1 N(2),N(2)-dimethylguanosine tRNA methyltransferase [Methanohalophilus mahii DSM 5219]